MNNTVTMNNIIRQEFLYPHPVENVWQFLTTPELVAQWLMPNDFQPVVGHEFTFRTKPMPHLNLDGIMLCKVLEVVPLQKLAYSWKAGPGGGLVSLDTVVVWTLEESGDGTLLRLEHSGFDDQKNFDIFKSMTQGWTQILQKMSNLLNQIANATTKG